MRRTTNEPRRGCGRLRFLAGAAAVVAAMTPVGVGAAGAATTTSSISVPGATITRVEGATTTSITVKATVARLDLWCSSDRLVVDRVKTTIPCSRLASVTTTGLVGADTVEINAVGFGTATRLANLTVKTGAGNDTITVRHRTHLSVWPGSGDDTVTSVYANGRTAASSVLRGEDGNDRLVELPSQVSVPSTDPHGGGDVPPDDQTTMDGGPGADRFTTSDVGIRTLRVDLDDVAAAVPANVVWLATGATDDTVQVHNVFLGPLAIDATLQAPGGVARRHLDLAPHPEQFHLDLGAGNDTLAIDGFEPRPNDTIVTGNAGTDRLDVHLVDPWTHDPAARLVTCDLRQIHYDATFERVTVS